MKNYFGLVLIVILFGCNRHSIKFDDKYIAKWEAITKDSISSLEKRNRNISNTDEYKDILFFSKRPYDKKLRDTLTTILRNMEGISSAKRMTIIEYSHWSYLEVYILLEKINDGVCYHFNTSRIGVYLEKKFPINISKTDYFIDHLQSPHDIMYQRDSITGETKSIFGHIFISVFEDGKIRVYPYLTNNFREEQWTRFINLLE